MIPNWNSSGVVPPIRPGKQGHDLDRSPYIVEFDQIVDRFVTSKPREKIIQGLLAYRKRLHTIGITDGFQWLDGSFIEDVETLENRPPNDVDVVTFFYLPSGETELSLSNKHPDIFKASHTKQHYHVDAYPCVLGKQISHYSVKAISYWYSMWSHRRNGVWKGFIQLDLASAQDVKAISALASLRATGVI